MGEWVTIGAGEQANRGYLALPERGSSLGVLVLHAWWGLNATFQGFCDRLAAAGFVALAPDLYGAGQLADTVADAEALVKTFDFEAASARAGAQRVGVLGCSLGASLALNLSAERPDAIAAVVAYYDAYGRDYSAASAAYLVHLAEVDEYAPATEIAAMRSAFEKADRDATIYVYPGTGHWFAEPERVDAYDAAAAELAWQRSVAFLREQLSA